jgi:hypothetical protein
MRQPSTTVALGKSHHVACARRKPSLPKCLLPVISHLLAPMMLYPPPILKWGGSTRTVRYRLRFRNDVVF